MEGVGGKVRYGILREDVDGVWDFVGDGFEEMEIDWS